MEKEKTGFFNRFKSGLKKTNAQLIEKIRLATTSRLKPDAEMLEELEEALITSDIGMPTTMALIGSLEKAMKKKEVTQTDQIRPFLRREIESIVRIDSGSQSMGSPHAILIVGVNGSGKTTTVGKLAHYYYNEGKSVLIAAADTFRAAATDQLSEWSKRAKCEIVRHHEGSDPSAVAFDAVKASVARKKDVLIIDTAGRLHTRSSLMDEVKKIRRIIARELEGAPHETLLVLDGTTGQNAIAQVKEFNSIVPLTGLVITKLDGTSKGGAIIGIFNEAKIPIKFLGMGEQIDDLQPFDPQMFAEAII